MMAIDDSLDAAEAQIRAEERADSPLRRFVPFLASLSQAIPVPALLKDYAAAGKAALQVAANWIDHVEEGRRQYLTDSLTDELRRVRDKLESHLAADEQARDFAGQEFLTLVLDGLQIAERTRSQKRISRIAAILAHSLRVGRGDKADVAEEMMRVATALSDQEVVVLREIYLGQRANFNERRGRTEYGQANDFWKWLDPTNRSISDPPMETLHNFSPGDLDGICVKLQSLGLLAQVPRIDTKLAPGITPYALLSRGVQFIEYIRGFE